MKKILLSLCFVVGGTYFASAQSVAIVSPQNLSQEFENTFADWPAIPDMTDPANRVVAQAVIARDDSGAAAGDSLMCNATSMDLTGKIAVLFRGACEFGVKAVNAWNAGAAGVVVVGTNAGELINMSSGSTQQGDVVTVPVVFIKKEDGQTVYDAIKSNANVELLLGNKIGYYGNDLGSAPGLSANVPAQVPVELAANTTDLPIHFVERVYNYGANKATNVSVKATITKGGSELYSSTSAVIDSIASGDSVDVETFTDYSGSLGVGDYTIKYEISSDSTDDSGNDNVQVYPLKINGDKLFSFARYDDATQFTFNTGDYGPSERAGNFKPCIVFQDPNASKLAVDGVWFKASVGDTTLGTMEGEEIPITIQKWNDVFTYGVDQPTFADLTDVASGTYAYPDANSDDFVYAPMDQQVVLEDNARYLVCATIFNTNVYFGYDNETKYDFYTAVTERYISPIADGDTWYGGGFVGGPVPSMTLKFINANEVSTKKLTNLVEAKVYPNPATDFVNVQVNNYKGDAVLTLTNLAGQTVMTQNVKVNGNVTFSTSSLTPGMYLVNMALSNGSQVKASVVVE